ncbi:MAG: TonB-dependent receptor [Gammaproteobacteria bacterium]|nr:TonB-dependent receptor [Gammaproteobacteria bacterium]MDD9895035.1 TonB-dependent receptor [Gammaproteobacteria bacterium]MDD9957472.1 TonB-dependent receptor [Gammaproteobacteria bacterium]
MIRKILVSSIATATAMAAIPVFGQTQSGQQAIEEIEVFSTNRRSEGLTDVNASVSVITEAELDLIAHTHYQEALARVPGVSGHRNNGQESLMAIRSPVLTGAGACGAFLVAENGIPIRSAGFCNVNEMFDVHSEAASSLEVNRGPASAFWGSNALHGLINVVLPNPGDIGEFTYEGGPRGSSRIKAAYGRDYGNFAQSLYITGVDEEGYRDNSGVDQQKLSWVYEYTMDNGVQMDGGISYINLNQETAGFVVGTNAFSDSTLRDSNPNPEAYRDSVNGRVWTRFSYESGNTLVTATPYFREVNMNFVQHFLPGQPIEDTEHRSLGIQLAAYTDLGGDSTFSYGLDIESTDGNLFEFQPLPTQGSLFLRRTIPDGAHYDYEVEARQIALFASYDVALSDNWDLSIGARAEKMKYDYDNKMIDGRTDDQGVACGFGGCRYARPGDRDDSFDDISPKIGLSYRLNENNTLQLRAQRGVRAPQATELYRLQGRQTVADLDSVQLDSYEIAFSGAGNNWDYSASAYFMEKENEILRDSSRANLNGSETEHRGLEIGVGYSLSDRFSIRGLLNLAEHTYENDLISGGININGNEIDTAPDTFGNLRLTYRPNDDWIAELEWAHMGEYYTNPENTADYGGHDLVNLRMQFSASDDLLLYMNVMNLTNEKYAERADWTTFTGDRYFPGEPARIFAGFTWKYR